MTDIVKAAKKLIDCVEFDMNGAGGKGGNGGLLSDTTLRAAHDLRVIMSREAKTPKVYNIGVNTMAQVFKPSGLTDLHDLQAVLDAVENAIAAQANIVLGWLPADEAPRGTMAIIRYRSGIIDYAYKTNNGEPFLETWRYAGTARRGEQAPWPDYYLPISFLPAAPAKQGDAE
jgi:hypothetical protein